MFHETNEVTQRVFELDDIYIWGFLIISLGGLLILMGQGIYGFYKKRFGPEARKSTPKKHSSNSS